VINVSKNRKKRKASKTKIRVFFAFVVFSVVTCALGYNLFTNVVGINKMLKEKKELKEQIVSLKEEKKVLETDILKLEDPDYIAKYVREKYFYSKEGEVILRIDD